MLGMTERKLLAEGSSPWLLEPVSNGRDLAQAVNDNRAALESRLLEHGALLFRGFDVSSVGDFEAFAHAISAHQSDYVYRSTPRTSIGNGIFTATEYPPSETIALHCENAYQRSWPLRVAFCCLTPAATGGETPIADMREVSRRIGPRLLDHFEAKQVRYVRHYRRHVDIPWETVFQTRDRSQVAAFCADNGIEHEWLDDDTLRTAPGHQAWPTIRSPATACSSIRPICSICRTWKPRSPVRSSACSARIAFRAMPATATESIRSRRPRADPPRVPRMRDHVSMAARRRPAGRQHALRAWPQPVRRRAQGRRVTAGPVRARPRRKRRSLASASVHLNNNPY